MVRGFERARRIGVATGGPIRVQRTGPESPGRHGASVRPPSAGRARSRSTRVRYATWDGTRGRGRGYQCKMLCISCFRRLWRRKALEATADGPAAGAAAGKLPLARRSPPYPVDSTRGAVGTSPARDDVPPQAATEEPREAGTGRGRHRDRQGLRRPAHRRVRQRPQALPVHRPPRNAGPPAVHQPRRGDALARADDVRGTRGQRPPVRLLAPRPRHDDAGPDAELVGSRATGGFALASRPTLCGSAPAASRPRARRAG